jgi:hypothetical protein
MKGLRILALVLALGALVPATSEAQMAGPRGAAGNDILTLNLYGGGYSPTSSLTNGSDFGRSATVGGSATAWIHPLIGLRGSAMYARSEVTGGAPAPLEGEKADIWAYSGDLVLRLPLAAAGRTDSWAPYVVGGLGGKSYDFETLSTESDFAGNFGGGLEYRFARWGLQAEVRDVVSRFDRFGLERTQHDIVWTAGITMSF